MARWWDEIDMQNLVKAAAEGAGLKPVFPPIKQYYPQIAPAEEVDEDEEREDEEREGVPGLVVDEDTEEADRATDVKDIAEHNAGPAGAPEKDFA